MGLFISASVLIATGAILTISTIALALYAEAWKNKLSESLFPNAPFNYLLNERCKDAKYGYVPKTSLEYKGDTLHVAIHANLADYKYIKVMSPNHEEAYIVHVHSDTKSVTVYPCSKKFCDMSKVKMSIKNTPVEFMPFTCNLSMGFTGQISS